MIKSISETNTIVKNSHYLPFSASIDINDRCDFQVIAACFLIHLFEYLWETQIQLKPNGVCICNWQFMFVPVLTNLFKKIMYHLRCADNSELIKAGIIFFLSKVEAQRDLVDLSCSHCIKC